MARRPVTNLLGLAVLGVLSQRPMHRYEIATTIREQGKDDDMAVKWGSLYTVVGNLERHGLVETTGTDRDGARPERTTYAITAAGRREMAEWTRELLCGPDADRVGFRAALSMLGALSPGEATALLRARVERLATALDTARAGLDGLTGAIPRLFLVEDEYDLAIRAAELTWLRGLVDELESGAFPGIPEWAEGTAAMHAGTTPGATEPSASEPSASAPSASARSGSAPSTSDREAPAD